MILKSIKIFSQKVCKNQLLTNILYFISKEDEETIGAPNHLS